MSYLQSLLFFFVSFSSSVAGVICGIDGGVIIKPVLDLFGWLSVAAISFLSGCTVLSMSCYSVGRSLLSGEKSVDLRTGTPMALGTAAGGVLGKVLFSLTKAQFANQNAIGAVQAVCLLLVTLGTLVYTLRKDRIHPRQVSGLTACLAVGLVLGYLFGMDTKTAAANSLYIILFSQITNFLSTLLSGSVPSFEPLTLALMVAAGAFWAAQLDAC